MPELPVLSPREVIRILERKGFVFDRSIGSHRVYFHPDRRRRVVVPMHKGDLPKGTFREILRQAGISKQELDELR